MPRRALISSDEPCCALTSSSAAIPHLAGASCQLSPTIGAAHTQIRHASARPPRADTSGWCTVAEAKVAMAVLPLAGEAMVTSGITGTT